MSPTLKHVVWTTAVLGLAAASAAGAVIASGAYNIAADEPHSPLVFKTLEYARERSMEVRASRLEIPKDLDSSTRVTAGAGNYAAMCMGCHLAPGMESSELSRGLYPSPPALSKEPAEPDHAFWAIKHGIKASGMPAWGKSMDDEAMWNLVAFLQRLPQLDEAGYQTLVSASGGHSHGGGDAHGDGDSHGVSTQEPGAHGHADADHHAGGAHHESAEPSTSDSHQPGTHIHADGKPHRHGGEK